MELENLIHSPLTVATVRYGECVTSMSQQLS